MIDSIQFPSVEPPVFHVVECEINGKPYSQFYNPEQTQISKTIDRFLVGITWETIFATVELANTELRVACQNQVEQNLQL